MSDLEAIIAGAVSEATESGTVPEPEEVVASDDTPEEVEAEETPETPETPVETPEEKPPAETKPEADDEEAFAKEHGLEVPKQGKRENRIPYPQVKKIVTNAQRKIAESVLGRPLKADEKFEDVLKSHVSESTTRANRLAELETKDKQVESVERIMVNEPERFLTMLESVNPKYKELIGAKGQQAQNVPVEDPKPEPDYPLTDAEGKVIGKTYSLEGQQKLFDWQQRQIQKTVNQTLDKELKPARDAKAAEEYRRTVLLPRLTAAVENARQNWPGFKDNEQAILKVVNDANAAHKPITLADAHIQVMHGLHTAALEKLTTDREKIRKEIAEETKKRAAGTSVASAKGAASTVEVEDEPGVDHLESVIKGALKAHKK